MTAAADRGSSLAATLLVVEDDPFQVGFYEHVLAHTEWTVRCAGTLAGADAVLDETAVDLVILDLMLPDGDGRAWLAGLRDRPGFAALPVIVVSGSGNLDAQVDCYALGATLLTKPIEPRVLLAMVGGALERTRRQRVVDEETGLHNRAGLLDTFLRAREAVRGPLALALLEPDDRREVAALPRALCALAAVAIDEGGGLAPAARWSESVVAALMPGMDAAEAGERLERARATARTDPRGQPLGPFSVGVADVRDGAGLAAVAAAAERELTRARLAGGDRVARPGEGAAPARTILVAEDDDVVAALLEHRLQREGFVVARARDGLEALDIASRRPLTFAILDVLMPGMDGFELLEKLRSRPELARLPIVMLTGLGGERDIERALAAGAQDYILKPFSPLELSARLHRLLRDA